MNGKPKLTGSPKDMIATMSEGNPGAINVMCMLLKRDAAVGFMDILNLNDMGMRGPAIWIAFKDHCGQDIEKLHKCLGDRDAEMVATVKAQGYPAVTGGASFEN